MQDKRVVTKERGETIAREHGIRFLETSAKANINIDRAFLDLAEAILNKVYNHLISINSNNYLIFSKLLVKCKQINKTK